MNARARVEHPAPFKPIRMQLQIADDDWGEVDDDDVVDDVHDSSSHFGLLQLQ